MTSNHFFKSSKKIDIYRHQRIRPVILKSPAREIFIRQKIVFLEIGEKFEGLRIFSNITL
jgi:hypothetical protein